MCISTDERIPFSERHADILNRKWKKKRWGIFNEKYYFQVGNQIKWEF